MRLSNAIRPEDAEHPQGLCPLLVGKVQANLAGRDRPSQVDLDPPILHRVIRIGLPEGLGIAINDIGGRARVRSDFPHSSLYFSLLFCLVGKLVRVERGVEGRLELYRGDGAICRKIEGSGGEIPLLVHLEHLPSAFFFNLRD